mmetsp:Transcript_8530/g.22788  ORF Transcript_8530/g.22788 Transcript_8530/m.22788 type:complete len:200 (+) Transcript_8530:1571-2170(+)
MSVLVRYRHEPFIHTLPHCRCYILFTAVWREEGVHRRVRIPVLPVVSTCFVHTEQSASERRDNAANGYGRIIALLVQPHLPPPLPQLCRGRRGRSDDVGQRKASESNHGRAVVGRHVKYAMRGGGDESCEVERLFRCVLRECEHADKVKQCGVQHSQLDRLQHFKLCALYRCHRTKVLPHTRELFDGRGEGVEKLRCHH